MSVIFIQENAAFYSSFDLSGLAQSAPQHINKLTVNRLNSSGPFARTLNLRNPLVFMGTLKKYA